MSYPRLLAVGSVKGAPPGAVPMMLGFITGAASLSAAHLTDYIVGEGTLRTCGQDMTGWLIEAALKTGLLTRHRGLLHGAKAYKLINDPEFIHIRSKAEIEWDRQQRNDTRDPRLRVPVLLRDGDLCRYCETMVHWRGRKDSTRYGTLDHIAPKDADGNRPPATPDTLVVACLKCNGELKDSAGEEREHLKPPPAVPFYGETTAAYLTKNGRPTTATDGTAPRPANAANAPVPALRPATADTASKPVSDPTGHRGGPVADDSPRVSLQAEGVKSDAAGSGRVGSGVVPLVGDHSGTRASPPRKSRRSRRARNRGKP